MKYALLIYTEEAARAGMTPADRQQAMQAYYAFTDEARQRGMLRLSKTLDSVTAATTVRVRDGKNLITDGPFAGTKEQLGGFYILECQTLDEAIAMVAKMPGAHQGSVEIRPVAGHRSP